MPDLPVPGTPDWYRKQAAHFAEIMSVAISPDVKFRLALIVSEYKYLAEHATSPRPVASLLREYSRHAAECDGLANLATSPEQENAMRALAEKWRLLARQREELLKSEQSSNSG